MFDANGRVKESLFSATVEAESDRISLLRRGGLSPGMRRSYFLLRASGNFYTFCYLFNSI